MPRLPARGGVIMPTERWKAWTCRITLRRRSTANLRIYRPGRTGQMELRPVLPDFLDPLAHRPGLVTMQAQNLQSSELGDLAE
ncbi:unnamed protein product [Strongylus vulgaris]|uniref:Uncharacterized protein n=1 Tax=Strongylus vulgaris TaxID=40348 RepID=A0A3P7L7D3_STRVU|nr:unnamed protein product [Strongylus vulgaris]